MNFQVSTDKVLTLLAENAIKNYSPQVVATERVASELALNVNDTRQLLRVLDGHGLITVDIDGHHALITSKGLQRLTKN